MFCGIDSEYHMGCRNDTFRRYLPCSMCLPVMPAGAVTHILHSSCSMTPRLYGIHQPAHSCAHMACQPLQQLPEPRPAMWLRTFWRYTIIGCSCNCIEGYPIDAQSTAQRCAYTIDASNKCWEFKKKAIMLIWAVYILACRYCSPASAVPLGTNRNPHSGKLAFARYHS